MLLDFHVMCTKSNDSEVDKRSCNKELPRAVKTFEYENTKSNVKCCDH